MAITRLGSNQSINLANNVTGTLPAANVDTLTSSNLPTGTVLQVVNSTGTDTTVNTSTPTTVSSLSITPSSTSSKIFVIFSGHGNPGQTGGWHKMQIYRDGTGVGNLLTFENAGGSSNNVPVVNQVLDTPSTTSSITYTTKAYQGSGSFRYGEGGDDHAVVMTAMEIKG